MKNNNLKKHITPEKKEIRIIRFRIPETKSYCTFCNKKLGRYSSDGIAKHYHKEDRKWFRFCSERCFSKYFKDYKKNIIARVHHFRHKHIDSFFVIDFMKFIEKLINPRKSILIYGIINKKDMGNKVRINLFLNEEK